MTWPTFTALSALSAMKEAPEGLESMVVKLLIGVSTMLVIRSIQEIAATRSAGRQQAELVAAIRELASVVGRSDRTIQRVWEGQVTHLGQIARDTADTSRMVVELRGRGH